MITTADILPPVLTGQALVLAVCVLAMRVSRTRRAAGYQPEHSLRMRVEHTGRHRAPADPLLYAARMTSTQTMPAITDDMGVPS